MLPKIARLPSGMPHRARWMLVILSLMLFTLPTWRVKAQVPEAQPTTVDRPARIPATAAPATMPKVEFWPQLSEREQMILTRLEEEVTFDFTDESLSGVIETLMERHGFDIIVDKVKLEEESIMMDATDVSLKLHDVPLRSALRLLLRQKNLVYVIENDVLTITTKADYETERLTRTYPVRDLTGDETAAFHLLMDAIRQGVTPGAWRDLSQPSSSGYAAPSAASPAGNGPQPPVANAVSACTISMVPASGSLVIRQSRDGHEEVLSLLRALRKAQTDSAHRDP